MVEAPGDGYNHVHCTKSGTIYHIIYSDCSHITICSMVEIFEGTVAQAHELKNITNPRQRCQSRARRKNEITEEYLL